MVLGPQPLFADQTCKAIQNDSSKEKNLLFARSNIGEFCKRNMFLRFLNSKDAAPNNCDSTTTQDLEEIVNRKGFSTFFDPWNLSLLSTSASRESAYNLFFGLWQRGMCHDCQNMTFYLSTPEDAQKLFSRPFSSSTPFEKLAQLRKSYESQKQNSSLKDAAVTGIFCAAESLFNMKSCYRGLDIIADKTKIVYINESLPYTNVDLWERFFGTKKYDEGLRYAALKLLSRATNGISAEANIFDDLIESYVKSGFSQADANEAVIDTMGLISNGGPNTLKRANFFEGYSGKVAALGYIANTLVYLDSKKKERGMRLYSYPKNVSTSCDNAKPYHFWNSAYLAKELKKMNFDDLSSVRTVYIAQIGYQLKREVGYNPGSAKNNPTKNAILTREAYDPAHQIVRTDLAYAAAGALFGVAGEKRQINVDKILIDLLSSSSAEPTITRKEAYNLSAAESYFIWRKVFAPDAALKSVLEGQ